MNNVIEFASDRPVATGVFGLVAGWVSAILHWFKLFGEFAGTLGVIFGCIAAFFSMLIVIRSYFKNKQKDE